MRCVRPAKPALLYTGTIVVALLFAQTTYKGTYRRLVHAEDVGKRRGMIVVCLRDIVCPVITIYTPYGGLTELMIAARDPDFQRRVEERRLRGVSEPHGQ